MKILRHGLKYIYGDNSYKTTRCPECDAVIQELKFTILPFRDAGNFDEHGVAKPGVEVRFDCKLCGCQWTGKRFIKEN